MTVGEAESVKCNMMPSSPKPCPVHGHIHGCLKPGVLALDELKVRLGQARTR